MWSPPHIYEAPFPATGKILEIPQKHPKRKAGGSQSLHNSNSPDVQCSSVLAKLFNVFSFVSFNNIKNT